MTQERPVLLRVLDRDSGKVLYEYKPNPKQLLAHQCGANEIFFGGSKGSGKGLSLDTPLLTPAGWTTMGDVAAGDELFAPDGRVTRVLHVSGIHERPCYRVVLSDGSALLADDEHRWTVWTQAQRAAVTRRTPEFRAARRATRTVSGTGKKPWVALRNHLCPTATLGAVKPIVVTTVELRKLVETEWCRPAIENPKALELPEAELPIHPYVLGCWLGDGTEVTGMVTSDDPEVIYELGHYYPVHKVPSAPRGYRLDGLTADLRAAGLLGHKHIPPAYLRASKQQRMWLLEGLMDTDGSAAKSGGVDFTTTREELRDGFAELVRTLGWRARAREDRAKLYGRDCGPCWSFTWTPDAPVFRLQRKRVTQRYGAARIKYRYVMEVEPVESVPTRCLSVEHPSAMFLAGREFVPTHNSFYLIFAVAMHCILHGAAANTVIFRRIYDDLANIIREFRRYFDGRLGTYKAADHLFAWNNGATTYLRHLERPEDVERHQGRQYTLIAWDELTHFPEESYLYLFKELRAPYGDIHPQVIAASNPGSIGHRWVYERFIEGKEPNALYRYELPSGAVFSRIYIPARLTDNTDLMEADPGYLGRLEETLTAQEYAALVDGDWRAFSGLAFPEWDEKIHVCDDFPIPADWKVIRCLDWGYSSPFHYGVLAQNPKTQAVYLVDEWYGAKRAKQGGWSGLEMAVEDVKQQILDSEGQNAAVSNYPKPWYGVADPSIWSRTGGENSIGNRFNAGGHLFRAANRVRPYGKQVFHSLLRIDPATGQPGFRVFGSCHEFRRCFPRLVLDDNKGGEDVDTDQEDHSYDSVRYGLVELADVPARPDHALESRYLARMRAPSVNAMV